MDTKWKNILKQIASKKITKILFGTLTGLLGLILIGNVLLGNYVTATVWFIGLLCNGCFAVTVSLSVSAWLKKKYRNWMPADENYYEAWKAECKKQQKTFLIVFLLSMLFAWWLPDILRYSFRPYYYYPFNYAPRYLLFATFILQCTVSEGIVIRFMLERLQIYMERMNEINNHRLEQALEKALEIEKESLEKVSRSDQLRMDLITNVSHDLKTPLTSMVGYVELLKKEDLNDTARDYLEVISNRADKLKEMIESLFTLAKVSSGNVELQKEHITLNRLIEQIFADMDDKIQQSELEFVTLLSKEDTGLNTDNGYMYRICQNLLENALKYSAKGTRVFVKTTVISAESEEPKVSSASDTEPGNVEMKNASDMRKICLEITNTAGYRMDFTKEDIIERFARADKARTTEGNGLGLAIVSTYAKALGGEFNLFIDCDQFKACLVFPQTQTA